MPILKAFVKLLPKKEIRIGTPDTENEGVSEEYFQNEEGIRVLAKCTNDCEYPVLFRELPPTQIVCGACQEVTLAGLLRCDKCGALIKKEE